MKLNYKTYGSGNRTIILSHYFGGNAGSWNWVVKRLEKKFSIVLITLPGFGNTEALPEPSIYHFADYINKCISHIGLKNYLLCGHSMSAKLILYAAQLNNGISPKGLVLIAPSPPTVENMPEEEKKRMLTHPNEAEAITTVKNATVKKLNPKRFTTAVRSQLEVEQQTWKWWLKEGMQNNIADRIQGIDVPTYVICARKDPVIAMDDIYSETLPHLNEPRLIQFGGCGHLIPLESPRKLARRLRKIAKRVLD